VEFRRVCRLAELSPGSLCRFQEGTAAILVCNVAGQLLAVDDTCTHSNWSLSEGEIEGEEIVCPLHGARFSLRTGEVLAPPAAQPLRTYPVRIERDDVLVGISDADQEDP
jgi:nitrite reductase/ring-hydroxylating ferredoxin subunit